MAPLAEIHTECLRELVTYWRSKRQGQTIPSRRDIDPLEIPHLLPYIGLVDILWSPRRYRFRLVGTHITMVVKRDLTGIFMDEMMSGPIADAWAKRLESAVIARTVTFGRTMMTRPGMEWCGIEWVHMPLSTDGSTIDMLLSGAHEVPAATTDRGSIHIQIEMLDEEP